MKKEKKEKQSYRKILDGNQKSEKQRSIEPHESHGLL
jgi:hypothetical protein